MDVTRDDRVNAWADADPRTVRPTRSPAQQRRPDQPQRPALGGIRRRFRPGDRREPQGGRERDPPRRPGDDRRGAGVIVNLSSGWGRSVSPEVAPYCATKWGVEGLTRALAQELPAAWPPCPSTPASSTPRCSAARSAPGRRDLPRPRRVGRGGRAVPARTRPQGQRQAAHRAGPVSLLADCAQDGGRKQTQREEEQREEEKRKREGGEGGGKPGLLGLPPFLVLLLPFFPFPLSSSPSEPTPCSSPSRKAPWSRPRRHFRVITSSITTRSFPSAGLSTVGGRSCFPLSSSFVTVFDSPTLLAAQVLPRPTRSARRRTCPRPWRNDIRVCRESVHTLVNRPVSGSNPIKPEPGRLAGRPWSRT